MQAGGTPLYRHGTGHAPACTAPTMDQLAGSKNPACAIQSTPGGVTTVFGFTNLPAQTVAAGVWSFSMYWTGGGRDTNGTRTLSVGGSATARCAVFVPSIPHAPSTSTS